MHTGRRQKLEAGQIVANQAMQRVVTCSGLSSIVVASLICTALCDIGNHNGLPAQLMVQMPVLLAVTPVSEPSVAFAASAVGAID